MSFGPRNRFLRGLIALLTLRFGRRRRKELPPSEPIAAERPEQQAAVAREREERRRRPDEEERLAEESERLEEEHEQIRRRPAEPPPTVERELVARPRMELFVAALLIAVAIGAAGFIVFYVTAPDTQLLGLTIGLAFAFLALATALAGKRLVPQEKAADEYHFYGDEERREDVEAIVKESADGISRRKLLFGAAGTAGATLAGAAAFPAASLGPSVGDHIHATPWRAGRRLVKTDGRPLLAEEVDEGMFLNAFPDGASRSELGSPLIVVRLPPDELDAQGPRAAAAADGILAFSKICTHAGCAVSIYRHPLFDPEEPRPALVCPCHYSTFDVGRAGEVVFGPASRPLPILPLRINADGELEAADDFIGTVGPTYGGSRMEGDEDT